MQPQARVPETEAEQLRERIWTYAQRGVLAAVVFFAGLFVGYQLWGQATQLKEQVEELTEKNQSLVKERDTERSRITLVERDKKEIQKQLEDVQAKLAAAMNKPPEAPAAPQAQPQPAAPQAQPQPAAPAAAAP